MAVPGACNIFSLFSVQHIFPATFFLCLCSGPASHWKWWCGCPHWEEGELVGCFPCQAPCGPEVWWLVFPLPFTSVLPLSSSKKDRVILGLLLPVFTAQCFFLGEALISKPRVACQQTFPGKSDQWGQWSWICSLSRFAPLPFLCLPIFHINISLGLLMTRDWQQYIIQDSKIM